MWTPKTPTNQFKRYFSLLTYFNPSLILQAFFFSFLVCLNFLTVQLHPYLNQGSLRSWPALQVIAEMTDGGVDRAIECTGHIDAMISAFECVHDVSLSQPTYKGTTPFRCSPFFDAKLLHLLSSCVDTYTIHIHVLTNTICNIRAGELQFWWEFPTKMLCSRLILWTS